MSFFYEILNDGTPYRRKKLRVKRLILTIAAALFMLITLLCSFAIIPSGYTGVRTTFGQIDTVAVSNGFIVKIPYVQSIKRVNNKQQEVSYTDQIWGESSERTVVYAAGVTVTYRINPDYSAWIYANVSDYKQNALPQTLLSSAIKAAMVSLPSDEVTNRAKIEPIARQQLQTAIDQKYGGNPVISIVAVNIDDIGSAARCVGCGQPHGRCNSTRCGECEELCVCKACGNLVPMDSGHYIDGDGFYCADCAQPCSYCRNPVQKSELRAAMNRRGRAVFLCPSCAERELESCSACTANHHCADLRAVMFCNRSRYARIRLEEQNA